MARQAGPAAAAGRCSRTLGTEAAAVQAVGWRGSQAASAAEAAAGPRVKIQIQVTK